MYYTVHLTVLFPLFKSFKKSNKNPQNIFLVENTTESWKNGRLHQRTGSIHSAVKKDKKSGNIQMCFVCKVVAQLSSNFLHGILWSICSKQFLGSQNIDFFSFEANSVTSLKCYFFSDFIALCNQQY